MPGPDPAGNERLLANTTRTVVDCESGRGDGGGDLRSCDDLVVDAVLRARKLAALDPDLFLDQWLPQR